MPEVAEVPIPTQTETTPSAPAEETGAETEAAAPAIVNGESTQTPSPSEQPEAPSTAEQAEIRQRQAELRQEVATARGAQPSPGFAEQATLTEDSSARDEGRPLRPARNTRGQQPEAAAPPPQQVQHRENSAQTQQNATPQSTEKKPGLFRSIRNSFVKGYKTGGNAGGNAAKAVLGFPFSVIRGVANTADSTLRFVGRVVTRPFRFVGGIIKTFATPRKKTQG